MSRFSRILRLVAMVVMMASSVYFLARTISPAQGQVSDVRNLGSSDLVVPVNSFNPEESQSANAQSPDLPGAAELSAATGGRVVISTNPATGTASFVRLLDGAVLNLVPRAAQPEEQARAFWSQYGSLFGISAPDRELKLVDTAQDAFGFTHLKYEQVYQGVPVFAAVLRVHLNPDLAITSVNGTSVPDLTLSVNPARSAADAAAIAVNLVAAQGKTGDLAAAKNQLFVYRTGLAQRQAGRNYLAYALEITNPDHSVREFVFIDAQTGKLLDQFSGIHEALDRKVSEGSLGNVVWQDSAGDPDPIPAGWAGGSPQQVIDWQNEIDGAAESYYLFASMTNGLYLSYDSADATMRTVNNDPGINCPNANWDGTSTNYCSGVTGDDTVAHEWGHAYTEYTSNLIYAWQPGALNESYSDIWGEVVDLLNGRGLDAPGGLRTAGTCSAFGLPAGSDNTYRWLSGEDDPAFGGAIRDMWTPTCYGDPGKVSDTQYWCATTDGGGVHTNSGVPNHAFALMVDGGTYNSQTITGIGLTKASHIQWRAQSVYLTAASDFADNADALEAACTDLTGQNLFTLSTSTTSAGPSGEIITAGDCQQVAKAIAAVQFRTPPSQCNFTPMLNPNTPAVCSGGAASSIFSENFEAGIGTWTVGTHDVAKPSTFDTPDWAVVGSLPDAQPGSAAFVADLIIGDCALDDESGALNLDSPAFVIPAGMNFPVLDFDHWVATELGWDGGNLKVSVNGGAWTVVPASAYSFNPYPGNLISVGSGNTNPLAGQPSFTGTNGGSVSGSWGTSRVDLSGIAGPGDSVRLRFDFGVDGCNGIVGWYVDNVEVYSCSAAQAPGISVNPPSLVSWQATDVIVTQTLTISNTGGVALDWSVDETGALPRTVVTPSNLPNIAATRSPGAPGAAAARPAAPTLDYVQDGSFEGGSPNAAWSEYSYNYGTPLCDPFCGGPPAATGSWYAWFGGASVYEEGAITQTLTMPSGGAADLTFNLLVGVCDSPADYMEVLVDGNQVYVVDGTSSLCGDSAYSELKINLDAYADGGSHTLVFYSETFANNNSNSNFFLDDVAINPAAGCDRPQNLSWLTTDAITGTVPGLTGFNLMVSFNSTGLSEGLYGGSLCVTSNDPTTPLVEVPVSMLVKPPFDLFLPISFKP